MRQFAVAILIALFLAAVGHGADDPPTASRKLDGLTQKFPAKSCAEGMKVTLDALAACHSSDAESHTAADLKKAQQGDHVRLVLPKPVRVTILNEKYEVSEVVFASGVFWVRAGDKVVRSTKYTYEQFKPFGEWSRQTLPKD